MNLAEDLGEAETLPVLLHLARESGLSPTAILPRLQRAGAGTVSWVALARELNLGSGVYHVDISPEELDEPVREALERFSATPRAGWDDLELSDEEVVGLVHVRVLSRQLGVGKGDVLAAYHRSGSWVESIRHLMGAP